MSERCTWHLVPVVSILIFVTSETVAQTAFDTRWNVADGLWSVDANWVFEDGSEAEPPSTVFDESAWIGNGGTAIVDSSVPDIVKLFIPNGTVLIQQGGSLKAVDASNEDASGPSVFGGNGTLSLSGNGSLSTVDLDNNGVIELHSIDSTFNVAGDLNHRGILTLNITRAGTPQVTVGGAATLAGTISANFDNSLNLAFGDSFEFLSGASSVTNNGARVVVPDSLALDEGLDIQVTTTGSTASLIVSNLPVLSLNRVTGKADIKNVVGGPLTLDSYTIGSERGLLNPAGWSSLNSQGNADWIVANPRPQQISELNFTSDSTLEVGSSLDLGSAYNGGATHPADEDVSFQFSTPDGRILNGLVEYTGPANDLVLNVDPTSGKATIQHLSGHLGPIDVTGYNIQSSSGALKPEGWVSFADSGAAGSDWSEANPHAEALAELNLTGSHVFDNGTVISIGSIFTLSGLRDLEFSFTNSAGEFFTGTVEYNIIDLTDPWDCNGDGVIDITDANCTAAADINAFLSEHGFIAGDLDGDGSVAFPDFLVLSANFGAAGQYTDGDINKDDTVSFPDFLVLSANFGQTAAATAAVPEPGSLALLSVAGALLLGVRRRRHSRGDSRSSVRSQPMNPKFLFLIAGLCLSASMFARTTQAEVILGTGTGSLVGGDLTDPEDNGDPEADSGYNATFRANDEEGFGGGEFAFNVFDNVLGPSNDKWCCGASGGVPAEGLWVEAQLDTGPYFLTSFTVSSANDVPDRDPIHWAIQGSNDATTYETIYEHNGESLWTARLQVIRFSAGDDFPEQTTPYQIFRHVTFNTASNPNGAYFQIGEIEFFGSLQAVTPGDFNDDGVIDMVDAQILADNFGTGSTFEQGDINRDFRVDLRDFVGFKEVFNSLGATAAAVPEPSSLTLLSLAGGALLTALRRGRRQRRLNTAPKSA